jgi:GxxExxY protein
MEPNLITGQILDACIKIHNELGPGLFESVYEGVLMHELSSRGLIVQRQIGIPVVYQGLKFEDGFRADLVVNRAVIVEIKSVEQLAPVHFKQVITYLKLSGIRNGILVNFNVDLIKKGFHRIFNNHAKTVEND